MFAVKLDPSLKARPEVAAKRARFDAHMDECRDCQPHLCLMAESLWRDVCLTALRSNEVR